MTLRLLVTLDEAYLPHLNVMLFSVLSSDGENDFEVYLLHRQIPDEALAETRRILKNRGRLIPISVKDLALEQAPTTARYPMEIYFRIFAARYLPETPDRILYLDPDLIVNKSLEPLYTMDLSEYFFAAASHTGDFLRKFNRVRLDMEENCPYINSGVMLMNLEKLRKEQDFDEVFRFIEKRKKLLILPDQDIISGLYGSKIYALDTYRYNMTERLFRLHGPFERDLTLDWIRAHSVIIHYCGKNKPWKESYSGRLNVFYDETVARMKGEKTCIVY